MIWFEIVLETNLYRIVVQLRIRNGREKVNTKQTLLSNLTFNYQLVIIIECEIELPAEYRNYLPGIHKWAFINFVQINWTKRIIHFRFRMNDYFYYQYHIMIHVIYIVLPKLFHQMITVIILMNILSSTLQIIQIYLICYSWFD